MAAVATMAQNLVPKQKDLTHSLPDLPEIGDKPHQPNISFPKREFGKTNTVKRSFQWQWFSKWQWLHYDIERDLAFCHTCVQAVKTGKIKSLGTGDLAFVSRGYCNWKDATGNKGAFNTHEKSGTHKMAVECLVTLPTSYRNVGEMLSTQHALDKQNNRDYLLKVFQNVQFLARQGIAMRGDQDESNSNFMQLLMLRGIDNLMIKQTIEKKTDKYTSPQIQNEILSILALRILRDIGDSIRSTPYYSLMADEVTDSSNREQVVICLRWVDKNLEPHEDFIGLYKVDSTAADVIVKVLKDTLLRFNLSISRCCGQCYDGASSMSGRHSGTAVQIASEEPRALYTHCYGHALNLAVGDTVKQQKLLCDALDVTYEISKLLKYSPRGDTVFEKLKSQMAPEFPGFRTLCPTRWTVRASSLESILSNYEVFQALWEEVKDIAPDADGRMRIAGVQFQMTTFNYLFGTTLGELILKHTDNLSKTLQNPKLTAADAHSIAELTCCTLEQIRNEESFDLFWEKLMLMQEKLDNSLPTLPRKRRAPERFRGGSGEAFFHDDPKQYYRAQYFEALDLVLNFVKKRFDQPGYAIYSSLESLLLKAARKEEFSTELDTVVQFYKEDFNPSLLKLHLEMLGTSFLNSPSESRAFPDVKEHMQSLSPGM